MAPDLALPLLQGGRVYFYFSGLGASKRNPAGQFLLPFDGDPFGLGPDTDFLVGCPKGPKSKLTIPGNPPFFISPQPQFVTTRGGEYLYQPSISALRWLTT